jgi:HK97 family phage prohead protease
METEHKAPEQRTIDVDVEAIDTRGKTLHGYAAVYNVESDDLGGFRERIAPGAFRSVLDADVRALLNHNPSEVLGRTKSGTLRLFDEQRGLRFEVDLPDSPIGENVREAVRRKDIDGASFRFTVDQESWQGDLRTVESVKELKDVTVATFGAYPAASVELRTRPENNNDATREAKAVVEEQTQDEERAEQALPAGSLRVEERAEAPVFQTLAQAYEDRGFFTGGAASVTWDEFRSFTWSGGTVLTDLNPVRREGVPLAYDSRWLYPVLPTTAVSDATTSIQYLRQSSRTLAGTAVIRPIDAVSTKPETSTTVEFKTLQLEQVASIQSNIPRIHAAQPMFQSLVEQDLRLAIGDGLDEVARRGIAQAGTIVKGSDDILEVTRKAMTLVQADGYSPNVLAIDPAGAQSLELLRTPGTEKFYIWPPGSTAPGPFGLTLRVWKTAGTAVLDADAYGRMYISPVELRAFEQDAGATNRQTVRMETNAGYAVERIPAARRIT